MSGTPPAPEVPATADAPAAPQSLAARWGPPWLEAVLGYALVLLAGLLCVRLASLPLASPLRPLLGAAGMVAACLIGFRRLNPRLVGLEVLGLILLCHPVWPVYAVVWMGAAGVGGLVAAGLLRGTWREADLFTWPALALLASFVLLLWLGYGFSLAPVRLPAERWLRGQAAVLRQSAGAEAGSWAWHAAQGRVAAAWLVIYYLLVWGATRLGRRVLGPAGWHPRESLIFFQLRQRQIFLLIAALVLAILGSLTGQTGLLACALPLLVPVLLGSLLAGLAITLFVGMLWQAQGWRWAAWLLVGASLTGLWWAWPVGVPLMAVAGLLDAWVDWRRLRLLAATLGWD